MQQPSCTQQNIVMACLQAELRLLRELLPHLTKMEVLLLLGIYWEFDDWKARRRLNLGALTTLKQLSMEMCYNLRGRFRGLPHMLCLVMCSVMRAAWQGWCGCDVCVLLWSCWC
jgi:hypothetical protein